MATIKSKSEKEKRCEQIFQRIQLILLVGMFVLLLSDWKISVCAFYALIWNFVKYEKGRTDWVVDEYEDGYPEEGLRVMFKSWKWLSLQLVLLYALLVWISQSVSVL